MLILNINGPINAGKSTVGKLLQAKISTSCFIEADDLLSDEEQKRLKLDFRAGIRERLKRLDIEIARMTKAKRYETIIFAYPLSERNYRQWKTYENEDIRLICVTLAPDMENCLKNRGTRTLSDRERQRIREMYEEGYAAPANADLVIHNDHQTPEQTADEIIRFLKQKNGL